ncbi:hypothetical protein GCM10010428_45250 [Actinosynnema pretiosum subsp. pretiosum]
MSRPTTIVLNSVDVTPSMIRPRRMWPTGYQPAPGPADKADAAARSLHALGYESDELFSDATPEDFRGRALTALALAPVNAGTPSFRDGNRTEGAPAWLSAETPDRAACHVRLVRPPRPIGAVAPTSCPAGPARLPSGGAPRADSSRPPGGGQGHSRCAVGFAEP